MEFLREILDEGFPPPSPPSEEEVLRCEEGDLSSLGLPATGMFFIRSKTFSSGFLAASTSSVSPRSSSFVSVLRCSFPRGSNCGERLTDSRVGTDRPRCTTNEDAKSSEMNSLLWYNKLNVMQGEILTCSTEFVTANFFPSPVVESLAVSCEHASQVKLVDLTQHKPVGVLPKPIVCASLLCYLMLPNSDEARSSLIENHQD